MHRDLTKLFISLAILFIVSLMVGCGAWYPTTYIHDTCTVTKSDSTSTIKCPDGTETTVIDGNDGNNGTNGIDGSNGHNVVFNTISASSLQCSSGGSVILMGLDVNDNLTLDVDDTNLQSATVCNGSNGTNGLNTPPTPFTPVAIINPCGDAPNIYDEVFLKLNNGILLSSFSDKVNGENTRFSLLTSGTYMTTDGDHCTFTLNASNVITYESHHY